MLPPAQATSNPSVSRNPALAIAVAESLFQEKNEQKSGK
jgi:hypothetical protein